MVRHGAGAPSDFPSAVHVRGGSSDQNLVLLDGIPVYGIMHVGGAASLFDPDAVREVYRLVAENADGTAKGLTRTFTTATSACTADSAAITAAERTVAQQKLTVAQQTQSAELRPALGREAQEPRQLPQREDPLDWRTSA